MGTYFSSQSRGSGGNTMVSQASVVDMTKSDKVVIFSKTYCPYCKKAKDVFKKLNQAVTVFELDKMDEGNDIQDVLGEITGARTVPRVFVDGKCIGGGSDVESMMKNGTLQPLLAG